MSVFAVMGGISRRSLRLLLVLEPFSHGLPSCGRVVIHRQRHLCDICNQGFMVGGSRMIQVPKGGGAHIGRWFHGGKDQVDNTVAVLCCWGVPSPSASNVAQVMVIHTFFEGQVVVGLYTTSIPPLVVGFEITC